MLKELALSDLEPQQFFPLSNRNRVLTVALRKWGKACADLYCDAVRDRRPHFLTFAVPHICGARVPGFSQKSEPIA